MSDLTTDYASPEWDVVNINKQVKSQVEELRKGALKVYYKNIMFQKDQDPAKLSDGLRPQTISEWLLTQTPHYKDTIDASECAQKSCSSNRYASFSSR